MDSEKKKVYCSCGGMGIFAGVRTNKGLRFICTKCKKESRRLKGDHDKITDSRN